MTSPSARSSLANNEMPSRLGRFVIQEEIGQGSSGVVYLAHDPVIDRQVAVKTLRSRLTHAERMQHEQQFINEARAAGQLAHAHIVVIYEVSTESNHAFIAMEYLNGSEVSKMLENGYRFSTEDVASIAWKLADALDHAHRRGVIHRDIKPSNIFLTEDHQPKIMDFGIARIPNRLLERPRHGDMPATLFHHNLLGTPNYMSPEQASGQAVDPRTDIYSLGAVMYEMLTGHKPFHASDTEKLLQQITSRSSVLAPHKLSSDIPLALSKIVIKAMHKNPEKRYPSAAAMALDIKRHLTRTRRIQRRTPEAGITTPASNEEVSTPRVFWPLVGVIVAIMIVLYMYLGKN